MQPRGVDRGSARARVGQGRESIRADLPAAFVPVIAGRSATHSQSRLTVGVTVPRELSPMRSPASDRHRANRMQPQSFGAERDYHAPYQDCGL